MMRRLIEPPTAGPTPAQAARIRQVHDLAAEFATLPADRRLAYLDGAVRKQTSGYDRLKTREHTPIESPLHRPLQALFDALVATEATPDGRTYDTKHGIFTDADLREAGAMTTRGELVFPVRYRGGESVYRTPAERAAGPEHKPFSVGPPPRAVDDGDDPWRETA